jgi:hypothetical protein
MAYGILQGIKIPIPAVVDSDKGADLVKEAARLIYAHLERCRLRP